MFGQSIEFLFPKSREIIPWSEKYENPTSMRQLCRALCHNDTCQADALAMINKYPGDMNDPNRDGNTLLWVLAQFRRCVFELFRIPEERSKG